MRIATIRAAWQYLRKYKRGLVLGFGALILKDVAAACLPLVIREGVDSIVAGVSVSKVAVFAVSMLALSSVRGFFQYWMRIILIGISRDVEYDMRNELFAKLTTLSGTFFARQKTGDIMARATNDLNQVRMMLGPGVMYWFETMLLFVFTVLIMLVSDWRLTLIALAPAPLVSVAVLYYGRQIHDRYEHIQNLFGRVSSAVSENLASVRLIRAFVQEDAEREKFARLNEAYVEANRSLAWKTGIFLPLLQALIGVTFLIVLAAGGMRVLDGKLSIGQFVMFQTYLNMLIWPMIAFGWVINLTQRGAASLSRIREVLDEQPDITEPASARMLPTRPAGEIEFRDVSVRYGDEVALNGISLRIPAGSTAAIVGHTGSGKTTLVSLIPRLLDPTTGSVTLDGHDLREYSPAALRQAIGFVPQETFLFSTTVGGNIAFGVREASTDDIEACVRAAGLEQDIATFPQGLETIVGERGITLSGGQKQRTAIARALMRDPAILILDDALSSVDTLTEERILQSLSKVAKGCTTILISHRVSTVRHADRIFVIENGKLAESGTHAELLSLGGYYADLHEKQLLEDELASA